MIIPMGITPLPTEASLDMLNAIALCMGIILLRTIAIVGYIVYKVGKM